MSGPLSVLRFLSLSIIKTKKSDISARDLNRARRGGRVIKTKPTRTCLCSNNQCFIRLLFWALVAAAAGGCWLGLWLELFQLVRVEIDKTSRDISYYLETQLLIS